MRKLGMVVAVLELTLAMPVQADGVKSFFPQRGLPRFIAKNWDLATFPSAVGPRLSPRQHSFATMGLKAKHVAREEYISLADGDGLYMSIAIVKRGDFNHDDLEDVVVCESDHADYGHLDATQPYFLTRYSATTPVVAIARDPQLAPGVCDWDPPRNQR